MQFVSKSINSADIKTLPKMKVENAMENQETAAQPTTPPAEAPKRETLAESIDREGLEQMKTAIDSMAVPVPMELLCPNCTMPHIDEGEWATTRTHKTHQCQNPECKHEWRPFSYPTVGVASRPFSETPSSAAIPDPKDDGTHVPEAPKPQTEEERLISRRNMLKALAGMNISFTKSRTPLTDKERAKKKVKRDMAKASRKQNRKNRK